MIADLARIAALWSHCVTERLGRDGKPEFAIGFDKLQAELGDYILQQEDER